MVGRPAHKAQRPEAHRYGVISAVEQDTPRTGATTIPTGLEESLPHTTSFGVIHVIVPLRLKVKGKLKVIKVSRAIDSGKARTFPLDTSPSKQHQPFTTNRPPKPHQHGGTIMS